jgi:hypothetical protein
MRTWMRRGAAGLAAMLLAGGAAPAAAQQRTVPPAPDRRPDEGIGPFPRLILRGATVIDGTGAPPLGPVDLVIEQNRIA